MAYHKRKGAVATDKITPKQKPMGTTRFEIINTTTNLETGEVQTVSKLQGKRFEKEPDYIKLYLDQILLFENISDIPSDILIAVGKNLTGFTNSSDEPSYFRNDKLTKMRMTEMLGIQESMISKYIRRMVKAGLLVATNMKGVYIANPCIWAKGSWENIKKLRLHFDLISGEWECDLVTTKKQEERR